jgi:radical SAM protein (TIGR01212 family)
MYKYSDSNKRYYTLDYFYKHKFNSKVCKISLDGGFTCPNKDGTVGIGGCIYCSKSGSAEYAGDKRKPLIEQFNDIKKVMTRKWPKAKFIGYFQANTNTYAPVKELKEKYEPILKQDNVIGLSIGTRCDAISDECLEYLSDLNTRTFLTIELGLQTIHEETSKLINRCHTLECFENMVNELRKRNINVVVHIINGLPYETHDMMIDTIKYLSNLDIQGIKIHALSILKNTELESMYNKTHFKIMSREEYINTVCDQLEYLREDIVVHRLTGDPMVSELLEPKWLTNKTTILNDIDKEMKRRDSYQGIKYNKKSA